MGVNYYAKVEACSSCGRPAERVHLGKASMGWAFSFRGYRQDDGLPWPLDWEVADFPSWKRLLSLGELEDENGSPISEEELLGIIESHRGGRSTLYGHDWLDAEGNRFTGVEFF